MTIPRAAFIQIGSFSNINERLRPALEGALGLPGGFEVLDLLPLTRRPGPIARSAPRALRRRGRDIVRRRVGMHAALEATVPMFNAMSAAAASFVRAGDWEFSFQTQSLFNGAVPGTPHFVYTDHTALANGHSCARAWFGPRWLALEAAIYRDAACVFATGANVATSLQNDYGLAADQIELVRTGVNVPPPASIAAKSYAALDLVFVGMDWERKGGPELIEALDRLIGRFPGLRLTVVGCDPGVERAYLTAVGKVPPDDVPAYLERATVFAMPARLEPAGIAYSEAAAFGLPVVATTAGGIPDRVQHGRTGLLVPPEDPAALAGALEVLVEDEDMRRRFGQSGRAAALEQFQWPVVAGLMAGRIGGVV